MNDATRTDLAELQGLLDSDPALRARYDAATEGRLPAPPALVDMKEVPTSIRIPEPLLDRARDLAKVLNEDPEIVMVHGRVTLSTALRLALLRGLVALEAEHAEALAELERLKPGP